MKALISIVVILLGAGGAIGGELNIVCTVTDLGWLARQVGGEDVSVAVLCPGDRDPHFLPAKPSLARRLAKADLLCYTGLELEVGWLPVLLEKARNPRIRTGQVGELDCSAALDSILEQPLGQVSRAEGDVHPSGNPHYLLDPRNGIRVARFMAERMAELKPEAAGRFADRAEAVAADLTGRLSAWEATAAPAAARPLVVHTKQWEYLAAWLNLDLLGAVEHRPGISPSPRHVSGIVEQAQAAGVRELIAAPWNHIDQSHKAADRMGATLVVLPAAVESLPGTGSYPAMFDRLTALLAAAAGETP